MMVFWYFGIVGLVTLRAVGGGIGRLLGPVEAIYVDCNANGFLASMFVLRDDLICDSIWVHRDGGVVCWCGGLE